MHRTLRELIDDFEADPTQWELIRREVQPSTAIRNRGGSSVQELFRHKSTGEEMVRHSLLKPDGAEFSAPHFRKHWK
jgi:hypothetical protein